MMDTLKIGQVLWLRLRFNNHGSISHTKHPYLVICMDTEYNVAEIAQLDSLAGKEHKIFFRENKVVHCDNPAETVLNKDGFVQLDNTFKIELFPELTRYRKIDDKLSDKKLREVIAAYQEYHTLYTIDEDKNVYIDRDELTDLNQ